MDYCTYAHRKADTMEIFYIGKGKVSRFRAQSHLNRSLHWKNTVSKHGLHVDILAYWEDEEDAYAHEIFLIECLRSIGISLVNLTDGGDGVRGMKHSDDFKAWQSERVRAESANPEMKIKRSNAQKRRFESIDARRENGIKIKNGWTPEKRKGAALRIKERFLICGHPRQKISEETLLQAERMRSGGVMLKDIATHLGLSRTHLGNLLRRRIRSAHPSVKVYC